MQPPLAPPFVGDQNLLLPWMEENHRRYGPIFRGQAYGGEVFVTTDPDHVEYILRRNWQNYRKGWAIKRIRLLLGRGLMVSEGDLWKRQRRMIQPTFNEKTVRRWIPLFVDANQTLLERWTTAAQHAMTVNVTRDISLTILEIILKAIFGFDYHVAAEAFGILSEESARTLQFAQLFRGLGDTVKDIITKRDQESSDILGMLMSARDRKSGLTMPIGQIVDETLTLIVAGHETTASTLNWAWYLLSQNPEITARLHAEVISTDDLAKLPFTAQIIEETMRLYPAGWLLTRQAIRDDALGDYDVPAKTEIYISPYVIHRRADLWPDPDRFNPDRFARGMRRLPLMPFSIGPRNCIGEHFARWEMLVHFHTIAGRLRFLYFGDTPVLDLGINLRAQHDFIMRPVA